MSQHDGHKVTNRHSSFHCDTCDEAFQYPADHCLDCNGHGYNYRSTSVYSNKRGAKYNCGKCKGTGKVAPKTCNFCPQPANYFTAQFNRSAFNEIHGPIRHFCQDCYNSYKAAN